MHKGIFRPRSVAFVLLGMALLSPRISVAQPESSEVSDLPFVVQLNGTKVKNVPKSSIAMESAKEIPAQLIIRPGSYRFAGDTYTLKQDGLYRFLFPNHVNLQRIVYVNDVDALLSAISWIHSHGHTDNQCSKDELTKKALQGKIFITCGVISRWGKSLLDSVGVKSRLVASATLDRWNTYDDGHALLEVWRDKYHKWELYDVDSSNIFVDRHTGVPMSLLEFVKAVENNDYEIVPTSLATPLDVGNYKAANGCDEALRAEARVADIRTWYARIMQVPLIYDESQQKFLFYDIRLQKKLQPNSSDKYVSRQEFMEKFYPHAGASPTT